RNRGLPGLAIVAHAARFHRSAGSERRGIRRLQTHPDEYQRGKATEEIRNSDTCGGWLRLLVGASVSRGGGAGEIAASGMEAGLRGFEGRHFHASSPVRSRAAERHASAARKPGKAVRSAYASRP